jgi:uncharacterized protein YbbC (DUF1343 family)
MKQKIVIIFFSVLALVFVFCKPATKATGSTAAKGILTGADQTEKYLPLLKGKRVAIMGNQTSIIGKTHLVDSLQKLGVNIVKVFGPEHGFRGNASAGAEVSDEIDKATGIPIISLYGAKSRATKKDLADVDVVLYDLQDVGCRFYTNINALARLMESCVESNKEMLILDRPNPNAYFVDGPVLDMKLKSGIGMFPIPITHGLTIGEFAQMLNGEGWLANKAKCPITVIPVANYDHDMMYTLPVPPSPNLNSQQSIMLYPSMCWFEGTVISQGRGTYFPFAVLGNPELKGQYDFSFTPTGIKGMAETPLHMNQACYGLDLRTIDLTKLIRSKKVNIQWMVDMYKAYPYKEKFFDYKQSKEMGNVDFRTGDSHFKEQIIAGVPEDEIRKSWEPGLSQFKEMRKKYLIYK